MGVHVRVRGLPDWVDARRLLGDGPWTHQDGEHVAELDRTDAADVQARLRNVGIGGSPIQVVVRPSLKRTVVRAARTVDARRRRDTTPGFTRPGTRLDDEGRMSLTPEALALALGKRASGASVLDICGGAGGNAIGFARAGCQVTLVEPDRDRLEMARHNAGIYGVADRIRFVQSRLQDLPEDTHADLLFADPPWGADWDRSRTEPEHLPLLPAILDRAEPFERAWLKLPPSFAVDTLPDWRPDPWFGTAEGDRQRVKFLILTRERSD